MSDGEQPRFNGDRDVIVAVRIAPIKQNDGGRRCFNGDRDVIVAVRLKNDPSSVDAHCCFNGDRDVIVAVSISIGFVHDRSTAASTETATLLSR